jgi:hypothetical protein
VLQKTSTSIRLLELLAKILGTAEVARVALHCSETEWDQWIHGTEEPPWTVFERMVDIVILYQSKEIKAHREAVQKLRSTPRSKD